LHSALFPLPLHKKVSTNKSTVIIVATGIGVGDAVNVNGTHGMTPTGWSGTITSHIAGNYWLSNNLKVDHEEVRKGKKITSGGGTEDVSVTVTNTTATSAPVTTTAVPTVP
jgi:hypothetical protein